MWFKNEEDRIIIPLTVMLDINNSYFNGQTLKMIHLRPHREAKTVQILSSNSNDAKKFFKRFRYI
jgi:hypothetical protein